MDNVYNSLYNRYKNSKFNSYESFNTYKEEVLYLFKQRLNDEVPSFPKYYFYGDDGIAHIYIILNYILFELNNFTNFNDLYKIYNIGFFKKYKLMTLLKYYDSIEDIFTIAFPDKSFDIYEFLKYNPRASGSKSFKLLSIEDKQLLIKKRFLECIAADNISLNEIPNIINIKYLIKNRIAWGWRQYFDSNLFELIDFVYPNIFQPSQFIKRVQTYNEYYNSIKAILTDNNITIYDLTLSMLVKYKCGIENGYHGINRGFEDVKINYCKYFNEPYYVLNQDKFREKLSQIYDCKTFQKASIKIGRSKEYLYYASKKQYAVKLIDAKNSCEILGLNFYKYVERIV